MPRSHRSKLIGFLAGDTENITVAYSIPKVKYARA